MARLIEVPKLKFKKSRRRRPKGEITGMHWGSGSGSVLHLRGRDFIPGQPSNEDVARYAPSITTTQGEVCKLCLLRLAIAKDVDYRLLDEAQWRLLFDSIPVKFR